MTETIERGLTVVLSHSSLESSASTSYLGLDVLRAARDDNDLAYLQQSNMLVFLDFITLRVASTGKYGKTTDLCEMVKMYSALFVFLKHHNDVVKGWKELLRHVTGKEAEEATTLYNGRCCHSSAERS